MNHLRPTQTTVGKRKQEDLEKVAPPKRAKPNPRLSTHSLPTPNRSPTLVQTATSPSISLDSSSGDGLSAPDTEELHLPPRHHRDASGADCIRAAANNREGIQKTDLVRGSGSRPISTTSSDTDSSSWRSPSEPATVAPERVTLTPSTSRPPFPLSRHALTSQNLTNLQKRLSAFLPALKTANQALEVDRAEGRLGDRNIEIVSNAEEPYIEMDLSLGVLEEKHAGIRLSDESSSGSTTDADVHESSALAEEGQDTQSKLSPKKGKEKDILGKLMGHGVKGSSKAKPKIEVLS